METNYTVPANTRIGHVNLKVAGINRSLAFYKDLLGFELTGMYGNQAPFISAGGYHHHIFTSLPKKNRRVKSLI